MCMYVTTRNSCLLIKSLFYPHLRFFTENSCQKIINRIVAANHINEIDYKQYKRKHLRLYRKHIIKRTLPICREINHNILDDIDNLYHTSKTLAHVRQLGEIYLIYKHVFDDNKFLPRCLMKIDYYNNYVYYGNKIAPSQALIQPVISFHHLYNESELKGAKFTIAMMNIDGNLFYAENQLIHWLVVNTKLSDGSLDLDIESGDTIYQYLPPIPWESTGNHRVLFVCFKQHDYVDPKLISSNHQYADIHPTKKRFTFNTLEFVKNTNVNPIALSWFQTYWDPTVTITCNQYLNMDEPIFEEDPYLGYMARRKIFFDKIRNVPILRERLLAFRDNGYSGNINIEKSLPLKES